MDKYLKKEIFWMSMLLCIVCVLIALTFFDCKAQAAHDYPPRGGNHPAMSCETICVPTGQNTPKCDWYEYKKVYDENARLREEKERLAWQRVFKEEALLEELAAYKALEAEWASQILRQPAATAVTIPTSKDARTLPTMPLCGGGSSCGCGGSIM